MRNNSICTFFLLIASLSLSAFPITSYDYHLPQNSISPIISGMGGINATHIEDPAAAYYNPAIVGYLDGSNFGIGIRIKPKNKIATPTELFKKSNIIDKSKLNFVSVMVKEGALSYIPLAYINETTLIETDSLTTKKYQNYYLNSYNFTLADKRDLASFGLTFKYLNGRLIHYSKIKSEDNWIEQEFIDDTVNGFSCDLGFYQRNEFSAYGAVIYDVFSKLYWKDNGNASIRRRYNVSTEFFNQYVNYVFGTSGVLKWKSLPTYHFGMQKLITLNNQEFPIRIGIYSQKFKNAKDIFVTYGIGYKFKDNLKIDISMTNFDMQIDNSTYLISFSIIAN